MTKGYVRDATWADLPILAADLRAADVAEIKASSGLTPEEAIRQGIASTSDGGVCRVICLPNGLPVAILGVVPAGDTLGGIWMVATNGFKVLHRQFLRECREGLDELTQGYSVVFNFTDARNTVHHRWLKWMGFTFINRIEDFGYEGRPFLEFVRITERHHV